MILVGCDLHTRKQQVALLNTDTGELQDQELSHVGADAVAEPGSTGDCASAGASVRPTTSTTASPISRMGTSKEDG